MSNLPFAPAEQQIEGMKCVLARTTPQQYIHSLDVLVANNIMSRSHRSLLIKRMRHILGMSYEEYQKLRSCASITKSRKSGGLWPDADSI